MFKRRLTEGEQDGVEGVTTTGSRIAERSPSLRAFAKQNPEILIAVLLALSSAIACLIW